MARPAITLEDVAKLIEIAVGDRRGTTTAVPTVQVQKDSFSSLVDGALKGWPFIILMGSVAFWILQSFFSVNAAINEHDNRISQTEDTLKSLEMKIDTQAIASNEIIRRLDNLQKDVEILKSK